MRTFLLILLLGLFGAGCELVNETAGPDGNDDEALRLYVTNQDAAAVTVIDVRENEIDHSVRLQDYGFSAQARPHHVAVEPDGSFWYVTLIGDGKVVKFSRSGELVAQADLETPGMLALHPTQDLLFVSRSMTAISPPASVAVIDRATMEAREIPVVYPRPHALSVAPSGTHVYTASLAENALMTVDVASEEVGFTTLDGPVQMFVQFAVSPDGKTMYVSGEHMNQLHVFRLDDPGTPVYLRSVEVGAAPWDPVFTPDGTRVYVPCKRDNAVYVLDATDVMRPSVVEVIEGDGLAEPHGSAVSPDGRYVYISNNNTRGTYGGSAGTGTVVVIRTATNVIERVIEVGANPTGMGMEPR